jgi:lysophospholipase L1-like esterase
MSASRHSVDESSSPAPLCNRGARGRRWGFRLAAIFIALLPFLMFEAACYWAGWGGDSKIDDPFIAFSTNRPLFEKTADGVRWQVTPSRRRFFSDESFPAVKPSGTKRVFVIGESTVAGEPFGKPTAFPTWLQVALDATTGADVWDIVNCGGVSYASYRLAPIVEECLTHEPDVIVLAVGHNEFLEDRTYAPIRRLPRVVRSFYDIAERSRGFRVIRRGWYGAPARPTLSDEIATRLDFEGGLAGYHRDDANRAAVIAHFEFNLRRIVQRVQAADVPLLLLRQPSNLSDCPPFKSEPDSRLAAAERQQFETLIAEAHRELPRDVRRAVSFLEQAIAIDPSHALTRYELGKCCEALGDRDQARAAFVAARDADVCPLRMISELELTLARVAEETSTPLVDLHALLEDQSPGGILGGFLLVDHVHPSVTGHQMIARRLLTELADRSWTAPVDAQAAAIDAAFVLHLASLDEHYYLRGQRTLRSLRAWAAGRAPDTPTVTDEEAEPK